jgi:ppGpp synthetase/RelA/SpoT-type nucleotidyltranferase
VAAAHCSAVEHAVLTIEPASAAIRASTATPEQADLMAWTEPHYTKAEVDNAARTYLALNDEISADTFDWARWTEYERALETINNWRSAHSYPLNTFQSTLRRYARKVSRRFIVAQRMKRLSSIEAKLLRFPRMRLTQMQDIGGCRAVLRTSKAVKHLHAMYEFSGLKHALAGTDDYIESPKDSGYRGIHLIYRYFSDKNKQAFNGLKIEVQLRSVYQHSWATAVETVGAFAQQAGTPPLS